MRTLALLTFIAISQAHANSVYYSLGESTSKDKSNTRRLGVIVKPTVDLNLLDANSLSLQVDISYSTWQNFYGPDIKAGSIVPMLLYQKKNQSIHWFVRFGVGLAYINQTRWGNRDLGDNWIFENKFTVGFQPLNNHALALSLSHYSKINLPNNET